MFSKDTSDKIHRGLFGVSASVLVNSTNVLFFVVVQSMFFKYKASKQKDIVLMNKMDALKIYVSKNPDLRMKIKEFSQTDNYKAIKQNATNEGKSNDKKNLKLLWDCAYTHFVASVGFIGLSLSYLMYSGVFRKKGLGRTNYYALMMVVGAYVTELLFFFTIVQKYEFVGDMGIVEGIYSKSLVRVLNIVKSGETGKCDVGKKR